MRPRHNLDASIAGELTGRGYQQWLSILVTICDARSSANVTAIRLLEGLESERSACVDAAGVKGQKSPDEMSSHSFGR